jgi:kynurenine formamidase
MATRIIDLTFTLAEGMTTFPVHWHPFVEITQLGRHGIENRETRKIVLGTHTGTHCDAPRHFVPGGKTIEEIPIETFVGPALVLDLTHAGVGYAVDAAELEAKVGARRPQRLVLRFDWDKNWGKIEYYRDHPYLTKAAAHWLVERGVILLAMDTPMPDNSRDGSTSKEDSPVHKILLGKGVILVEYLTNLKELRKDEVELAVLPLRIKEGDGAPARVVAIERD